MNKTLSALLCKSVLSDKDKDHFVEEPYYRNQEGELGSSFQDLKRLWLRKPVLDSFEWVEENKRIKYYRLSLENGQVLDGKVVYNKDLIAYIYEALAMAEHKRYFCLVSYDGTRFEGYQKQKNKRTVQGEIEGAIKEAFQEDIKIHASGRTDKGVHAHHQTFHFDGKTSIPTEKLPMVIGQYLPEDIYLKRVEEKPGIFHARYDAISKTYMYHLDAGTFDVTKRNYRWYVQPFHVDLFQQALLSLVGTHDFASFTKTTEKQTIRTILHVSFVQENKELKVFIKGTGFLRYMVRNLIMAAYLVATDKVDYSMIELLERRDNTLLRQMADPGGLYLFNVDYEKNM